MFGLAKEEWQDLVLSVNVHRKQRRLSPYRAACLLDRALANATIEELADALGFEDTTTLRKIHRLHELSPTLASVVHWGTRRGSLSMSTASELMRLDSEASLERAFSAAIEHNLTRDEARQLVQVRQRTGNDIDKCVEQALITRPRIERSELVLGSFISRESQEIAESLGEGDASRALRLQMAKEVPQVVPRALRISDGRFSLLLSQDDAGKLRAAIGDQSIESKLTELMERARR